MNVDKQPKTTTRQKRSYIRHCLRGALILAVALVVLLAVFYAFVNWRGNRAWNQYREAAEARGQSFRLASRTPAMEAHIQASITSAKELEKFSGGFDASSSRYINDLPSAPYWQFEDTVALGRRILSVKSGQTNKGPVVAERNTGTEARAAAAAIILESFQEHDAFLEKLRTASNLGYPFGYSSEGSGFPPTPNIFGAINVCRYLKLRITAELAVGRTAEALRDLELALNLSDSLRKDDLVIASIGSIACRNLALPSIWAGLADRRFTDAELQHLQQQLASVNSFADLSRVLCGERNFVIAACERVQRTENYHQCLVRGVPLFSALSRLPDGWMQLEKLNFARSIDVFLATASPDGRKGIRLDAAVPYYDHAPRDLQDSPGFRVVLDHAVLASALMPKLLDLGANYTSAQVVTDQIRLACGLERFYLKQARYPENLSQIAPDFLPELPVDPLSGEDYRYALDQNGRYKLWSVGPDGKDNSGVQGEGPRYHSRGSGDWVWRYLDS